MTADQILLALQGYAVIGLVVAVPFALIGVGQVADGARGWTIGRILFRLWVIPGAVVVWPLAVGVWIAALLRRRTAA